MDANRRRARASPPSSLCFFLSYNTRRGCVWYLSDTHPRTNAKNNHATANPASDPAASDPAASDPAASDPAASGPRGGKSDLTRAAKARRSAYAVSTHH
jgi:hypothetical protein